MKNINKIKSIMSLLLIGSFIVFPSYSMNNKSVELIDSVVELEWGTKADDDFRTFDLNVKVSNNQKISFISSNEAVVKVSSSGQLRSRGYGQAMIMVTNIESGETDEISVGVFLVGDEEIPLSPVTFVKPYVLGYSDGSFKPEANIKKSELATMLVRALDLELIESTDSFWYTPKINTLKAAGIIKPLEIFSGEDLVTREELAVLLNRVLSYEKKRIFLDGVAMVYDIDEEDTSKEAIYNVLEAKLMFVNEIGLFQPNETVTRAEAVFMINKLIDRNPYLNEEINFSDVMTSTLYYGEIKAASSFYNVKYKD